ncbi:MAG: PAS domain S-box protein, partial [Nitrososphaerota archaeon]
MQKYNITKILANVVIGIGVIVIIGWFFDIQVLKSLSPSFVTMKLSTAISFVMSGIIIYLMNEIKQKDSSFTKLFLVSPIIIIIFFMVTLFVSNIFGARTGIEDILIKETETTRSVTAGRPSIGTMVSFILIVILSLAFIINPQKNKLSFIIGTIIVAISSLSLIGYATDLSFLYYEIEGKSTAMALHTSIAFAVAGTSMILLSKPTLIQQHSHNLISIKRKIAIITFSGTLPTIFFIATLEYTSQQHIIFTRPGIVAIIAFALIATIFISKLIITPINNLTNAVAKFQVSYIEQNIDQKTKSHDEVQELVATFEQMKRRIEKASYEIKRSELKFKQLYENSPDLLRTVNMDGIIIDCNDKYAQHLKYAKDEVLGKSIFEHIAQESIDAIKDSFETWKNTGIVRNKEMVFQRKDGTKFPVLLSATNLYDERGMIIGSNTIIRDISELKDAQKQIQELQRKKLSVIGELAARLAHDLRNPLTVIKNTVDILNSRHMYELTEKDKSDTERLDR